MMTEEQSEKEQVKREKEMARSLIGLLPRGVGCITTACGDPQCPGVHAVIFADVGGATMPVCELIIEEKTLAGLEASLLEHRGGSKQ